MTTGACDVQGVVSGEARPLLPLRDGVIEVESCNVAMSIKLHTAVDEAAFSKERTVARRKKRIDLAGVFFVSVVDVRGRIMNIQSNASR